MIKITLYIDVIFFENLIMNTIILYATSIMLKLKPKLIRIIISSGIGSIYVIILYITKMKIYTTLISKIILSIIMIYIAFNPQNVRKMWKQILIFYLTSFVFGGVALYLIYFVKPQDILIRNGMFVGEYVLKVIMLGAIVGVIIIKISLKIIKTKINPKDMYCDVKIKLDNKEIMTKAMIDTGNLVKEPITNTPVVIVESSLLYEIIPKEILNNIEEILCGNLENVSEETQIKYASKLRCIPYKSLGKENGMLLGIKADGIQIIKEEEIKLMKNVIIGIYDKSLTKRGEYRALVGIDSI